MSQASRNRIPCWWIDAAGVGACLGLTLLVFLLGVEPMLDRHAENARQQVELDDRKDRANKLATAADNLARRLEEVGQQLDNMPVQLQTTRQLNQRLAYLTSLAADCGLAIDQTNSGQPLNSEWYQTVPIRLAGEGTYPTCAVFLDRLRSSFPDTGVSALEVTGKPGNALKAAGFRFDLIWYVQPTLSSAGH